MREELEVAAAAPEDTAGTGLADLGPPAPRSPSRPGSPATLAAMMRGAAAIGASSDEQGSRGNIVFFRPGACSNTCQNSRRVDARVQRRLRDAIQHTRTRPAPAPRVPRTLRRARGATRATPASKTEPTHVKARVAITLPQEMFEHRR